MYKKHIHYLSCHLQHMAVRTLENIASQGGRWAACFSMESVAADLAVIMQTGQLDGLRAGAASTLCRLMRFDTLLVAFADSRYTLDLCLDGERGSACKSTGFSPQTEGSFAGMEESSTKVQAASLNMFVLSLLQPSLSADSATVLQVCVLESTSLQELMMRVRHLQDTEGVTRVVMARLENSQPVIQGKALLALAVLFQVAPDCLPLALEAGLLLHVRCFSHEVCKPQHNSVWY